MSNKGVLVSAYLVVGRDDDLIDQWNALSKGERSEALREALEHYFEMPPSKRRNPLARLMDDIDRVIRLLEEIRTTVKELAKRPIIVGEKLPTSVSNPEAIALAEARNDNMKRNAW